MSQYDIVFHTDSECDQSELSNSFSQPGHPIYKQAIENAQSQASSYEQFLSQLTGAQIYTGHVDYNQGSFPVSPGYCQLPTQSPSSLPTTAVNEPSAQSWTDLFPELFPQSFWSIEDQRRWDELIRWEMAQPGYPVHPGRIFGSNHLGWNLQATSASHDVVPISSDNHHQSGGLLGTVGYWNPVEEKVTLKGWKYEVSWLCQYLSAWLTLGGYSIPICAGLDCHPTRGLRRGVGPSFTKANPSVCLQWR